MQYGARDWTTLGAEGAEAVERAAALGLDGVELNVRAWPPDGRLWSSKERRRARARAAELGVDIPSLGFGVLNQAGLAGAPPELLPRAKETLAEGVRVTHDLGARVMMLQHLGANRIDTPAKLERVVAAVNELLPLAEELGVVLALEDTLDARQNIEFLDRVGSPNLRVYYDVCNTWGEGHDVPNDIRLLGRDRIAQVHFKDRLPDGPQCNLGEGIVDVAACADALRSIGYDGWVLIETPAVDDPIGNARRNLDYLRRYI